MIVWKVEDDDAFMGAFLKIFKSDVDFRVFLLLFLINFL